MKSIFLLILPVLLGLLVSCSPGPEEKLIVLQTGRMAGNAYPLEARKIAPLQHYPYLAGYVAQVRAEAEASGARVLLIDSGDSLAGSFASYVTDSRNMVTLFNHLEYDALFLGNLDANCTPDTLASLKAPVLSPFTDLEGIPLLPDTPPVRTLDLNGLPVRLIANFFGDTSWKDEPTRFPMWFGPANQEVRPVRDYHPYLGNPEIPPAITLFHWMKFSEDQPPQPFLDNLIGIGVDAVLAHRTYSSEKQTSWETSNFSQWPLPVSENILQINRGFTLARMDLIQSRGTWRALKPHKVIQLTANTAPADSAIIEKLDAFLPALKEADTVLGILPEPVSREQILKKHMMAMAQQVEADAVIYSLDSIRAPLSRGTLSASTLFLSLPWTTRIETMELTRQQVLSLKEIGRTVLLTREDLPENCTLITSRFFARLVQEKLGLVPSTETSVVHPNEFEFFRDHLSADPIDEAFESELPNWEFHNL